MINSLNKNLISILFILVKHLIPLINYLLDHLVSGPALPCPAQMGVNPFSETINFIITPYTSVCIYPTFGIVFID